MMNRQKIAEGCIKGLTVVWVILAGLVLFFGASPLWNSYPDQLGEVGKATYRLGHKSEVRSYKSFGFDIEHHKLSLEGQTLMEDYFIRFPHITLSGDTGHALQFWIEDQPERTARFDSAEELYYARVENEAPLYIPINVSQIRWAMVARLLYYGILLGLIFYVLHSLKHLVSAKEETVSEQNSAFWVTRVGVALMVFPIVHGLTQLGLRAYVQGKLGPLLKEDQLIHYEFNLQWGILIIGLLVFLVARSFLVATAPTTKIATT